MNIFDRYAPFVQDFIYRNNWESLRAIQVAAADAIFNTDDNVLLSASTASGKTEAAFFPILTLFSEDMPRSVGAIYIGPLKALINDQFMRLNELCAEANIPVWHWHGDVPQSHKNKMLKNPSGILQITPESLEALLLHKHSYIPKLFGDLRFIVIDEVHSLMRGDRGGQTLCLIDKVGNQLDAVFLVNRYQNREFHFFCKASMSSKIFFCSFSQQRQSAALRQFAAMVSRL